MQVHRKYFGEQLTPWEINYDNNILFSATSYPIHKYSLGSICSHRVRKRSEQSKSIPINTFSRNQQTTTYSKTITKFQIPQINNQKNLQNLLVKLSPLKNPKKKNKKYTLNFFKRGSNIEPNGKSTQVNSQFNKIKTESHMKRGGPMRQEYGNGKVRSFSVFI